MLWTLYCWTLFEGLKPLSVYIYIYDFIETHIVKGRELKAYVCEEAVLRQWAILTLSNVRTGHIYYLGSSLLSLQMYKSEWSSLTVY